MGGKNLNNAERVALAVQIKFWHTLVNTATWTTEITKYDNKKDTQVFFNM